MELHPSPFGGQKLLGISAWGHFCGVENGGDGDGDRCGDGDDGGCDGGDAVLTAPDRKSPKG